MSELAGAYFTIVLLRGQSTCQRIVTMLHGNLTHHGITDIPLYQLSVALQQVLTINAAGQKSPSGAEFCSCRGAVTWLRTSLGMSVACPTATSYA